MDTAEIAALFEPWRVKHERIAWKPVTSDAAAEGLSWFGGAPSAAPGHEWPACETCSTPMRFFLQLHMAELPAQLNFPIRDRVLQLFYCSTDDGGCETWRPFSGTHQIRFVEARSGDLAETPPPVDAFPRRPVVRWDETSDAPDPEEHRELGLTYQYDFKKNQVSVASTDPSIELENLSIDLDVAEAIGTAMSGDKLAGWPHWVQGVEYPSCPVCQARMQLLLQVDSEDNLPYMFGDVGCAHLTFCPNHPEICAFGWACG